MEVKESIKDNKIHYILTWEEEDINHYLAGCPGMDCVIASAKSKYLQLYIFPKDAHGTSEAFKPMPEGNAYFIYLGIKTPTIPPKVSEKEFNALDKIRELNLEQTIKSTSIPIQILGAQNKPLNIGYVSMDVK